MLNLRTQIPSLLLLVHENMISTISAMKIKKINIETMEKQIFGRQFLGSRTYYNLSDEK
jgi:hypothetical protein